MRFNKINIVFTGVNVEPEAYGYDTATNVSGLLERIPFNSIKEAFLQILPEDRRRIVHYSDSSPTSDAVHLEMDGFDWLPIQLIEHNNLKPHPLNSAWLFLSAFLAFKNEFIKILPLTPSKGRDKWCF